MKVLLIGNYENSRQQSMLRFAEMLREGLTDAGHEVRLVRSPVRFGRLLPGETGMSKWIGYIDRFVLYPPLLRRQVRWADVVHVCDQANAVYIPHLRGKPHVVTCHDMMAIGAAIGRNAQSPIGWTGRIYQRWILDSLRQASRIACVSRHTYENVQTITGIPEERLSVVQNALNYPYQPMKHEEANKLLYTLRLNVDCPFFLHVGGNQWYKNRLGVLRLFAELIKHTTYALATLVMAGKPWTNELRQLVSRLNLEDRVTERVNVTNEQLRALYSNAEALLFPSIQEGFGWPIVEAQACGCPVVTTNRPPMNDVGGKAAIYIDLGDLAGGAKQIVRALTEREHWRETGMENVKRFSEKEMIRGYIQCYQSVTHRPPHGGLRTRSLA